MKYIFTLTLTLLVFTGTQIAGTKSTTRLDQVLRTAGPDDGLLVWVYFTDKGRYELQKSAVPLDVISDRALKRRARAMDAGNLVDYSDLPVEPAYVNQVAERVGRLRHSLKWINAVSVTATPNQIRAVQELPFVRETDLLLRYGRPGEPVALAMESAPAPDAVAKTGGTQAPDYGTSLPQVSLENIPAIHNTGNSAQGILIGVMDNGFRLLNHQAFDSLRSRIVATYDFVDHKVNVAPNNPSTSFGDHGINTLSALAGYFPGQLIGPAYGASFILARTENDSSETPFEEDNWARAIEWAESLGVQITSTSLGYDVYNAPYRSWTWSDMNGRTTVISRAAVMAARKGVIVVNSAGNEGSNRGSDPNSLIAPADADSILAVGAVSPTGVRANFSSFGPTSDGRIKPDVMAVGTSVKVASAVTPTAYGFTQGTSFSCPLTAGVAALVLKARPTATPQQIVNALKATASRASSPDNFYGWGIVNGLAAINYLGGSGGETPRSYVLEQNYPNPFNPETRINFLLPEQSLVTIKVFDLLGREVTTLVDGTFPASSSIPYQTTWNGTGQNGMRIASGVYFYRLDARGISGTSNVQVRKMMLMK